MRDVDLFLERIGPESDVVRPHVFGLRMPAAKNRTFVEVGQLKLVLSVLVPSAVYVALVGWLGYREMGISQFPEIDFPVVNITTNWEAASPDIMDGDVTDIIEDAVSGVEGIDYIQSQSLEGTSVVTVYFHLSRNVDVAMQDVQNAVSAVEGVSDVEVDMVFDQLRQGEHGGE